MRIVNVLVAVVFTAVFAALVSAQSVVITPKKTTYRRPKPTDNFKKTFTIRRPIAKASTPALSKKITAAISPDKVLDIRLKDELSEEQWLEEADYKVLLNQNNVLCIELWMTGTAAYPDDVKRTVVIDLATGNKATAASAFKNLPGLAAMAKKAQAAEIKAATIEMKKDPDADPEQLFAETNFTVEDLKEFAVDAKGVTIIYDYGFPHVIEALQPSGRYTFTWAQMKPYVRSDGLLAAFVR